MTTSARYDEVADYYAAEWSDDLSDPVTSTLLDLLGPVADREVLEIACGHGRVSRGLARLGASSVVGVDLSAAMLAKAAEAEAREPLGITYLQADAASADLLAGRTFDAVLCSFGLSDIDDLDGTLATVRRVLRPGGVFAFCILHPCFPGVDGVSGAWPTDGSYYAERWWQADGSLSTLRQQVGANHRTLSTYLNSLRQHGFTLDVVAEPEPAIDADSPRAAMTSYPVFLVARCVL
jgi:SAM-dependent methyltransferase